MSDPFLGEGHITLNSDATLTQVKGMGYDFTLVAVADYNRYFHRNAEIAAPLPVHESIGGGQTAKRIGHSDGLLQHETSPHIENRPNAGDPVQYRKNHRTFVALALAQLSKHINSPVQIVAVNHDGIELLLRQRLTGGIGARAHLDHHV